MDRVFKTSLATLMAVWPMAATAQQLPAHSVLGNPTASQAPARGMDVELYFSGGTSVFSNALVACNGTSDDTTGIAAVLTAAASTTKWVFVPKGVTCRTAAGLTPPTGMTFDWRGATIKKLGTAGQKVITVAGDDVTLLAGVIDGNNDSTFAGNGVFCQNHSGLTIKGLTTQNFVYEPIYTVDCANGFTGDDLNLLGGDSVDGLGSAFMAVTADAEDFIIRNSKCNRLGSIAAGGQACFNVVGDGSSIIRRFVFTGNGCVGVSTGGTLFQSCLQNINFAQADSLDGPIISYNRARWCNYCFTFDTLTSGSVVGNAARNVLPNGYTYEMSNCKNTTFAGNSAEGTMEPPGVFVLINVSNDCVFSGGTLKNLSTDALSAAVDFTPFGSPAGSGNILSGVTIVIAGGTGIVASDTNSVISGVMVRGGVTGLNLTGGSGRVVTGSVFTGQSGPSIINADPTDIICGNNVLGCNSATANSGIIEFKASVNFNSANTDTALPITLPPGFTRYVVQSVRISGASQTLTTATAGAFTAAAGGGVAVVTAASAITVSTAADATNNNTQAMTVNNAATESYTAAILYFRVATAQGAAATGTVTIAITPMS